MKRRQQVKKIVIAAILFVMGFIFSKDSLASEIMFLISYVLAGYDVIGKALRNMLKRQFLDENFLMVIATFGAIFLKEYSEAVGVMLFYQIGELFQSYAVNQSRKSVAALMDIRPEYANLKQGKEIRKVSPDDVKIGDVIVIESGERVPLDGVVIKGVSLVDTSAVTGESVPRELEKGDKIISGSININGLLEVKVQSKYQESTVSKILDLVENASNKKAKTEQFITEFARLYTPIVVVLAILLAIIPPLFWEGAVFQDWLYRALTFLVISCPCALVISIPLSFFGGIGAASKQGILIKGSNYLQALSEAETIVFDKTGTLTKGNFTVVDIQSEKYSPHELLRYAAYAGFHSSHPVSKSIREAYKEKIDNGLISSFEEIPAHGVKAEVDGHEIYVGSKKLLEKNKMTSPQIKAIGSIVYVAIDGEFAGWIRIADEIKSDAKQALKDLKDLGIKELVMLTGDTKAAGKSVAKALGLDKVYTELLPHQKVSQLEHILQETKSGKVVFVGDGLNDAPVLARADIGIAMGGVGSDAAIEAADIVIMTDEPSKIVLARHISQKTMSIVKENIIFALGIKFSVLGLGAIGIATMWAAVFADVGVSVIAILNAIRTLYVRR